MKNIKLYLLIAFAAVAVSAKAQIQKGNVLVGGNLTNIDWSLNGSKVFSLDITPKAAWFVEDNVALGGYVNLGVETAKHSSTTTSYGVGALGRYYTGNDVQVLRHGRIFAEATAGFGGVDVSGGGGNTNGINLSAGPGFAYFVTPSIGLETLVKYNALVGFGSTNYQHNLNLSFGFQVYLPGRGTATKVRGDVRK